MSVLNKFSGWSIDEESFSWYVDTIKYFLSSEENFSNFRQPSRGYGGILEHVCEDGGNTYGEYVLSNYGEFLKKYLGEFKKNDDIGNPVKFVYNSIGEINPTTARYIKYAGDIFNHFGQLKDYNLIEIGAGYGGLSRILNVIYKFKSIKLVDLPQPLKLQSKYLSKFNIDCETYSPEDKFSVEKNTLVVSNFAWCECDEPTRDKYIKNIISRCSKVYMVIYNIDVEGELMVLDGGKTRDEDIYRQSTTADIFILNKDEN